MPMMTTTHERAQVTRPSITSAREAQAFASAYAVAEDEPLKRMSGADNEGCR